MAPQRDETFKQKGNYCIQHTILQKFTNFHAVRSWSFQNICNETRWPRFFGATLYTQFSRNVFLSHRRIANSSAHCDFFDYCALQIVSNLLTDQFLVDALAADLQSSQLITTSPTDVDCGINCYNSILRALIDKHAAIVIKRLTARSSSARWYDSECRDMKRQTPKLERKYRRLRTAVGDSPAPAVWCTTSTLTVQIHSVRRLISTAKSPA